MADFDRSHRIIPFVLNFFLYFFLISPRIILLSDRISVYYFLSLRFNSFFSFDVDDDRANGRETHCQLQRTPITSTSDRGRN